MAAIYQELNRCTLSLLGDCVNPLVIAADILGGPLRFGVKQAVDLPVKPPVKR
ncbi:MAG: hypothetical protein HRU33_11365 [Rhodobacteraceae bacterium]|nr:hypothetical protein [Paracoccaceae bacterium]